MSAKSDREHFEEYRAQTLAKHAILEKYIFAYFNILKTRGEKNLVYVDGFAGRGTYDDASGAQVDGSPLRALTKIASNDDLAKKVTTIFIEKDGKNHAQLEKAVGDYHAKNKHIREPNVIKGNFAGVMDELLKDLAKDGKTIAPAFVFVDPCGVDGVDFDVIRRILEAQKSAEVFIFFNLDGVRRILGLENLGPTLARLLGSPERAKELVARVNACADSDEREQAIVTYYEELLKTQTRAKYVTLFRVEKEEKRTTSHYLIHAAQHPLGFAIMKDVMWSVGKTAEGKGGLELE